MDEHINNIVEEERTEESDESSENMMNLGIEPNEITFNILIKGWCRVGKMS